MEFRYKEKDCIVHVLLELHELENIHTYLEVTALYQIKKGKMPALDEILMLDKVEGKACLKFTFKNMDFAVDLFEILIEAHKIEGNLEAISRFEGFLSVINPNHQGAYAN